MLHEKAEIQMIKEECFVNMHYKFVMVMIIDAWITSITLTKDKIQLGVLIYFLHAVYWREKIRREKKALKRDKHKDVFIFL